MVGVPRSKGCRLCVQRRVKCDLSRPFCNNCKKGNRPCPGYGQDLKFQDEGPRLRRQNKKVQGDDERYEADTASIGEISASNSALSSPHPSPDMVGPTIRGIVSTDLEWNGPSILSVLEHPGSILLPSESEEETSPTDIQLRTPLNFGSRFNKEQSFDMTGASMIILSPDIVQKQLLHQFATSVSPGDPNTHPVMRNHGRWLSHLPSLTGTNKLLDTAIRAVTLAHVGLLHGNDMVMAESRPYYGKALRLLNSALLDDVTGMSNETLSATILLSFYEMFASDSSDSWIRHAGGAGALMRIRGAARHRYGFDREIYLAYRHSLIIESFQRDTPCFLNNPEWRELSRQIHNDIREARLVGEGWAVFDAANDFFMEMVQVPGVACDAVNLTTHAQIFGSTRRATEDVIERAEEHRANLKTIFARFQAALRSTGAAPTSYVSGDPVIPIYYNYGNIFIASSHSGYWSILMVLNLLLRDFNSTGEGNSTYDTEMREAALDCCRSEPYMEKSAFLGPFFIIFALRLCLSVLEPRHEREWVVRRLLHIGNKNMSMAKYLPGNETEMAIPIFRAAVEATSET